MRGWVLVALVGSVRPWQLTPAPSFRAALATKRNYFINEAGFVQLTVEDVMAIAPFVIASIGLENWSKKKGVKAVAVPKTDPSPPTVPTPELVDVAPAPAKVVESTTEAKLPPSPPPLKPVSIRTPPQSLNVATVSLSTVATRFSPDMVPPAPEPESSPEPVPVAPVEPVATVAETSDQAPQAKKRKNRLVKFAVATVVLALCGSGLIAAKPAIAVLL